MINRSLVVVPLASFVITVSGFSVFGSGPTPADSLTLAWDPSTDPSVVGYRLYQGGESQVYPSVVDIGPLTTVTISSMAGGVTYYFAVTAYDTSGLESAFSSEISYTVPIGTPGLPPFLASVSIAQNHSGQVVLAGIGPAGTTHDVYATQDFVSWFLSGSVTLDASGSFQFTDPNSALSPSRFYRLR